MRMLIEGYLEIIRRPLFSIFSVLVVAVLAAMYLILSNYGFQSIKNQAQFLSSAPFYLILKPDFLEQDKEIIVNKVETTFQNSEVDLVDTKEFSQIWSELGMSQEDIDEIGLKLPQAVRVSGVKIEDSSKFKSQLIEFTAQNSFFDEYIFNDRSFREKYDFWHRLKKVVSFFVFSSFLSLIIFLGSFFLIVGARKRKEIRIQHFLGASRFFVYSPILFSCFIVLVFGLGTGVLIGSKVSFILGFPLESKSLVLGLSPFIFAYAVFVFILPMTSSLIQDANDNW